MNNQIVQLVILFNRFRFVCTHNVIGYDVENVVWILVVYISRLIKTLLFKQLIVALGRHHKLKKILQQ